MAAAMMRGVTTPILQHITSERESARTLRMTCLHCGESERMEAALSQGVHVFSRYVPFYREHSNCPDETQGATY